MSSTPTTMQETAGETVSPGCAVPASAAWRRAGLKFANLATILAPEVWARHSRLFSTTCALVIMYPSSFTKKPVAAHSWFCPLPPGPTANNCTTAGTTFSEEEDRLDPGGFCAASPSAKIDRQGRTQIAPRRKWTIGRCYSSLRVVNSQKLRSESKMRQGICTRRSEDS